MPLNKETKPTLFSFYFIFLQIFFLFTPVILKDFSQPMFLHWQYSHLTDASIFKSLLNKNHHHVVPLVRISLTLSCHFSLSFIASGRSSGLHPISSHSCCMYVLAGCPAFARPYVGVHRSISLMSSSLLLQQCPACLVCLTWIVFMMGGRWPYGWGFVGCCLM